MKYTDIREELLKKVENIIEIFVVNALKYNEISDDFYEELFNSINLDLFGLRSWNQGLVCELLGSRCTQKNVINIIKESEDDIKYLAYQMVPEILNENKAPSQLIFTLDKRTRVKRAYID